MDYYNARYYDPVVGVFLSADTVQGNTRGMNPYAYVGGNPETKNDPTGKIVVGENGSFGHIDKNGYVTSDTYAYDGWKWDSSTSTEVHTIPVYNPNTDANNSPLARFSRVTGWTDFQHVWNDPHASWQDKLTALRSLIGTTANNVFQLAMILGGGEGEGAKFGGEAVFQTVIDTSQFGKLTNLEINISEKGLEIVRNHLSQFLEDGENTAMLQRLQDALTEGRKVVEANASFYMHELSEATFMKQGMSQEEAHLAAIANYGISPRSIYAPEVIQMFPQSFNQRLSFCRAAHGSLGSSIKLFDILATLVIKLLLLDRQAVSENGLLMLIQTELTKQGMKYP